MNPSLERNLALKSNPSIHGDDAFLICNESTVGDVRVTSGQLQAVAMRFREELGVSLRRRSAAAVATVNENKLTVAIEQSLSAAEHDFMQHAAGRAFFQHYVEELVGQIYPSLSRHVETILPCAVTTMQVQVDYEQDRFVFTCGLRPRSTSHSHQDCADIANMMGERR